MEKYIARKHNIEFQKVTLHPSIHEWSIRIPEGAWIVLDGPDALGMALFCDLCFGFIEPDSGSIKNQMRNSDVNFLGRSATTYGNTLLDHIQCSAQNADKHELWETILSVFSKNFYRLLDLSQPELLKFQREMSELDLLERDFMELSEANALLQKRTAVVIDTTSDFYQQSLAQGFRHSHKFLNSHKTIFWITDSRMDYATAALPWHGRGEDVFTMNLYFSRAPRGAGIN